MRIHRRGSEIAQFQDGGREPSEFVIMPKKRFLVVDDEPDIREVISVALSIQGYHVDVAPDRDTALKMVVRHGAPDVIFLDYFMPGLSIEEFLGRLKHIA